MKVTQKIAFLVGIPLSFLIGYCFIEAYKLYTTEKTTKTTEIDCLAKNIYFEAGVEGYASKLAVANVTRNRVLSDKFPDTYCAVVKQGHYKYSYGETDKMTPIKNKCHFSWVCDGKTDEPYKGKGWHQSLEMAHKVYYNGLNKHQSPEVADITENALWYHTTSVAPNWSKNITPHIQIGSHVFFRAVN